MKHPNEIGQRSSNYYVSGSKSKAKAIIIILLIIILWNPVTTLMVKSANTIKLDKQNLEEPVQVDIEDVEEIMRPAGYDVRVVKKAEYTICGRVVATYNYRSFVSWFGTLINGNSGYNDIAVKDAAITFGKLARNENNKKMEFTMGGFRHILFKIIDSSILNDFNGSKQNVYKCVTNNHLVPANKDVAKLIQKIEKDDYVQISGYLINAYWNKGKYNYTLESSTNRDDTGNGACEIILVEKVKWIK